MPFDIEKMRKDVGDNSGVQYKQPSVITSNVNNSHDNIGFDIEKMRKDVNESSKPSKIKEQVFTYEDLDKWASENNYEKKTTNISFQGSTYTTGENTHDYVPKTEGALWWKKKKSTDEQDEEYKSLKRLADKNDAKSKAKTQKEKDNIDYTYAELEKAEAEVVNTKNAVAEAEKKQGEFLGTHTMTFNNPSDEDRAEYVVLFSDVEKAIEANKKAEGRVNVIKEAIEKGKYLTNLEQEFKGIPGVDENLDLESDGISDVEGAFGNSANAGWMSVKQDENAEQNISNMYHSLYQSSEELSEEEHRMRQEVFEARESEYIDSVINEYIKDYQNMKPVYVSETTAEEQGYVDGSGVFMLRGVVDSETGMLETYESATARAKAKKDGYMAAKTHILMSNKFSQDAQKHVLAKIEERIDEVDREYAALRVVSQEAEAVNFENEIISASDFEESSQSLNAVSAEDYTGFSLYPKLTDEEKRIFNYLYNTKGRKGIDEYEEMISNRIYTRMGEEASRYMNENLDGIAEITAKYGTAFVGGIVDWFQGISRIPAGITGDDTVRADSPIIIASNRNVERAKSKGNDFEALTLQATYSTGNMVPSILIGKGAGMVANSFGVAAGTASKISSVAFSTSFGGAIYGNTYQASINEGKTPSEANAFAVLSAASEVALQNIIGSTFGVGETGVKAFLGTTNGQKFANGVKNVIARMVKSEKMRQYIITTLKVAADMGGESIEESAQELLSPIFRNIIFDENNEIKLGTAEQFEAGISGALVAFVFQALPFTRQMRSIHSNSYGLKQSKAIINIASKFPEGSAAKNAVDEYLSNPTVENLDDVVVGITTASKEDVEGLGKNLTPEVLDELTESIEVLSGDDTDSEADKSDTALDDVTDEAELKGAVDDDEDAVTTDIAPEETHVPEANANEITAVYDGEMHNFYGKNAELLTERFNMESTPVTIDGEVVPSISVTDDVFKMISAVLKPDGISVISDDSGMSDTSQVMKAAKNEEMSDSEGSAESTIVENSAAEGTKTPENDVEGYVEEVAPKNFENAAEGENIVSLKHSKNIYSLFKDSEKVVIGKDMISDGGVMIPLTDEALEKVKKVASATQENSNFELNKFYNKENDVVIKGNPKIFSLGNNPGYLFDIDGVLYACQQKYIDAFNNGKNTIKANKDARIPWTVHNENGEFVALFLGAKPVINDTEKYNSLPYASEVLDNEKHKKTENASKPFNKNEVRTIINEGTPCFITVNENNYVGNGHVFVICNEESAEFINTEYREKNSNSNFEIERKLGAGNVVEKILNDARDIANVSEPISYKFNNAKTANAYVFGDYAVIYNKDYANLIKKRSVNMKIISTGSLGGTLLVGYDEDNVITGFALPISSEGTVDTETGEKKALINKQNIKAVMEKNSSNENIPAKEEDNIVDVPGISDSKYTVSKETRTDNGAEIWVARLKDRISKEDFAKERDEMKKLGGYYSKIKKGFVFNSEPRVVTESDENVAEPVKNIAKKDDKKEDTFGSDLAAENVPFGNTKEVSSDNIISQDGNVVNSSIRNYSENVANDVVDNVLNNDSKRDIIEDDKDIKGEENNAGKQSGILETESDGHAGGIQPEAVQEAEEGKEAGRSDGIGSEDGSGKVREHARVSENEENAAEGISDGQADTGHDSDGEPGEHLDGERGSGTDDALADVGRGVTSDSDDTSDEASSEKEPAIEKKKTLNKHSFRIVEDIDSIRPNFIDNYNAIKLLKKLEESGKKPTEAERAILAKYKGWGGVKEAFSNWSYDRQLREVLTDEEYKAARAGVLNAHYTSTKVIAGIYKGLTRLGFKGGNILEPSMGTGNFFGVMPKSILNKTSLYGVELDSITGRIAKMLYPDAEIEIDGFQNVNYPDECFDAAIGNVPFSEVTYSYRQGKYTLHDMFFLKTLDKVKEGGIVMMLTSTGTLDKLNQKARTEIANRANLIAAFRLPNDAFKTNAGTQVTTDLIVLQKKGSSVPDNGVRFQNIGDINGIPINEYFVSHPENILGELVREKGMYAQERTQVNPGTKDFQKVFDKAIASLPKDLMRTAFSDTPTISIPDINQSKSRVFEDNGKYCFYDAYTGEVTAFSGKRERTARGYTELYNAYKNLVDASKGGADSAQKEELRGKLNKIYDAFHKQFGALQSKNNQFLAEDENYVRLTGLELLNVDTGEYEKSEIFTSDTIGYTKPSKADNSTDALAMSINETGKIDFNRMGQLTGKSKSELAEELSDKIILTPDGEYKLLSEYLSGNIYEKIDEAKKHDGFERNIELLESVLPTPKTASEIVPQLGATWISSDYVSDFIFEILKPFGAKPTVYYNNVTGEWAVDKFYADRYITTQKFGTGRATANEILIDTLNMRSVKVYDTLPDKTRVLNQKETALARQKQSELKEAFSEWIFKDKQRRDELVDKYNRVFNNHRNMDYTALSEFLTFPGVKSTWIFRDYQKRAVARVIFGGNTLLAHGVGTGKTSEMIASAMEMKRMGITKKNIMVVPKHKVGDFRSDILKMYPNAKVLMATEKDFARSNRGKLFAKIATNDWDIVIVGHTSFGLLPVSRETQAAYIEKERNEIEETLNNAREASGRNVDKRFISGLEKALQSAESKLNDLLDGAKDDDVTFEELGIDGLFVDEAHNFKNLNFYTKLNLPGVKSAASKRASDLFMKCNYLRSTGGRIVFATATPITNTVSEIYNMMRFVSPETLENAGIHSFDSWASTFGSIETKVEMSPDGRKFRTKERFSKYFNVPEMVGMFRQVADVLKTKDVVKELPEAEYIDVISPSTNIHETYIDNIVERIQHMSGGQTKTDNMLLVTNDGRAMATDLRLVASQIGGVDIGELDVPESKINNTVKNVIKEYKNSKAVKGTQFVFLDFGMNEDPEARYGYNLYNDITAKLVRNGIPAEEIANIGDYNTQAKKDSLFKKINNGEIRVLIGSTAKMGEGMNAQERAVALHHINAPYRPSDIEQREGRIIRYGNKNKNVRIYRYIQEKSFDSYMWQMLARKAEFINQAMSDGNVSEIEETDEFVLSAKTGMAVATGNPLILEKVEVDEEVKKLQNLQKSFNANKYSMQDQLATLPLQIERSKGYLDRAKADFETAYKHGEEFSIKLGKTVYEKRSDAAKVLAELTKNKLRATPKDNVIGEYKGLKIIFREDSVAGRLFLQGENLYEIELGASVDGNLTRIANAPGRIIKTQIEKTEKAISVYEAQLEEIKKDIDSPFKYKEQLDNALKRQAEINTQLGFNADDSSDVVYDMNDSFNEESDEEENYSFEDDSAEELFKPTTEEIEVFMQQVDKWLSGNMKSNEQFELGATPVVLEKLGANKLPVVMSQDVMVKMTGGKHSISTDEIKNLPYAIADPIMVLKSATVPDAFVLVTELVDKSGNEIVTALHLNRKQDRLSVNRIASAYGKYNIGSFIEAQAELKNVRYIDKQKCQQWSTSRGLQLPKLVQSITDNNNILQKEDIVNSYYMQNSENHSEGEDSNESIESTGRIYNDGDVGRKAREDTGRQVRGLAEMPGRTGEGEESRGTRAVYGKYVKAFQHTERKVIGNVEADFIDESMYNDDMKTIVDKYAALGKKVMFFSGNAIVRRNGKVVRARGVRRGDVLMIQADHAKYSAWQIAEHEYYHTQSKTKDFRKFMNILKNNISRAGQMDIIRNLYANYEGVAEGNEAYVLEEFACDVLSGMSEYSDVFSDIVTAYKNGENLDIYDVGEYTESIDAGGKNRTREKTLEQIRNGDYGKGKENNKSSGGQDLGDDRRIGRKDAHNSFGTNKRVQEGTRRIVKSYEERKEYSKEVRSKGLIDKTNIRYIDVFGPREIIVDFVLEEAYNDEMIAISEFNKKRGISTHFFFGSIQLEKMKCGGFTVKEKEVFISYDLLNSPWNTNKHELIHELYETEQLKKIRVILNNTLPRYYMDDLLDYGVSKGHTEHYSSNEKNVLEEWFCEFMAGNKIDEYTKRVFDLVDAYWNEDYEYIDKRYNEIVVSNNEHHEWLKDILSDDFNASLESDEVGITADDEYSTTHDSETDVEENFSFENDTEELAKSERIKEILAEFEENGKDNKQFKEEGKLLAAFNNSIHKATRVFEQIPERGERGTFFAEARKGFIQWKALPKTASLKTQDILNRMTKGLSESEYKSFSELVYFLDLQEEAKLQRERGADEVILPNGITSEEVDAVIEAVKSESTDKVFEAIEQRKQMWKDIVSEYVKYNKRIGFDVSNRFTRENYFHHEVLEHLGSEGSSTARTDGIKAGRGWLKERKGSDKATNTNFLQVEYRSLLQIVNDTYVAQMLYNLKKRYDIKPELVRRAKDENKAALDRIIVKEATGPDGTLQTRTTASGKVVPVSETYEQQQWYNKRIMMGFSNLIALAENGVLDDFDGQYSGNVSALSRGRISSDGIYDYIGHLAQLEIEELTTDEEKQAVISARTILKYTAQKRAWIKNTLGRSYVDWEKLAKEMSDTHTIYQPRKGNFFYSENVVTEQNLDRVVYDMAAMILNADEDVVKDNELRRALEMYSENVKLIGAAYEQWVLPKELTDTMKQLTEKRGHYNRWDLLNAWKGWVTSLNPLRTAKFFIRNLVGDADAVIAGNPGILKYSKRAANELMKAMKDGKYTSEFMEWVERGGFSTTYIADMTPEMQSKLFDFIAKNNDENAIGRLLNGVSGTFEKYNDVIGSIHTYRESLLRYSAYLYYKDVINKNGGKVKDYVASNRDIVNGLESVEDKAYQLSKDLLGAYDEVNAMGQSLRKFAIPFWSFTETNFKRYTRLFENSIRNEGSIPEKIARPVLKLFQANLLGLIMIAWNKMLFGDEEDELPPTVREVPHIIIGKYGDTVVAFRQLGSFSELLEWVGLEDRKWTKDDIKEPVNKLYGMFNPFVKASWDLLDGKNRYPDVFSPYSIRDRWGYVFNSLGLTPIYNYAAGLPQQKGVANAALNCIVYTYDVRDTSYNEAISLKYDYKDSSGYTAGYTDMSNDLYYMKKAIRYGDKNLAIKFADKFIKDWQKEKGVDTALDKSNKKQKIGEKIISTFDSLNPGEQFFEPDKMVLKRDKKDEYAKFLSGMTDAQKKQWEAGLKYYYENLALPIEVRRKLKGKRITDEQARNFLVNYIESSIK